MSMRSWFGVGCLLLTACGPMPGYQMPQTSSDEMRTEPRSPPAPVSSVEPRAAGEIDEAPAPDEGDDAYDDQAPAEEEVTPAPRAPKPPRYTPERNWDPPQPPEREPTVAPPEPPRTDGIKIVKLDADSYYLIDSLRRLCFLRHKESMTAVDCARIPEANDTTPTKAPERMPEPKVPERMPEPSRAPSEPTPSSPSPDEMMRFESAFIDIYCDRKLHDETAPESRIRERGLTTVRYEAIEAWWAGDENAWYALTSKAAKACSL